MDKFGSFITKNRWWIILIWLVAAVLIVSVSPSLSSVESTNENNFIPKNYESVKAIDAGKLISPTSQDATDIIVFKNINNQPLSAAEISKINHTVTSLNSQHLPHVLAVSTSLRELSPNRKLLLGNVIYSGDPNATSTINAVKGVRQALSSQLAGSSIISEVTGGESINYDAQASANRALKIVSIGTLLIVLILPALIFRSPLAGILPILAVGLVDRIASALIADSAKIFKFSVNQQLSVIFTVVLFGIGTDYILFLLFRYRERLRYDESRQAVAFALSRAGIAILSAALVVLTSFIALSFAKFGIFSTMAPGLVICVAVMMLAALTLIPALVSIIGKRVFWPGNAWKKMRGGNRFTKTIGGFIASKPALVCILVIIPLVVLGLFAFNYKADFSSFGQPPKGSQSDYGYNDLTRDFPAGLTNPTQVYVTGGSTMITPAQLKPLEKVLTGTSGVGSIGPAMISPNGSTAVIPVYLNSNPFSDAALVSVAGPIRQNAHNFKLPGKHVYVGGVTAIFVDIKSLTDRDLRVIFPIAAVFIFVILAVILRSLVAPIFLLLAVVLGYWATLGTTTLLFIQIGSAPGLIFFIPIFMYIFVVAIGTDYNILTITRLREEIREGHPPRKSADLTIEHSSTTVYSAGLILAATFGSLLLAGFSFLTQMGSAIAIGVLLSAFVIAPMLIPSVSALIGYKIWWPGHVSVRKKGNKS
jgi:putative drug exporter of the RND superfamily